MLEPYFKVVETIAKGEIGAPYGVPRGQRVDIDYRDHHTTVSLFSNGESKSWVLTGYTIDVNTDAKGRGSDLSNATQNDPIRTRAELGAALKSDANLQGIFNIANEIVENHGDDDNESYRLREKPAPKYMLWRSKESLESKGFIGVAEDVVMRMELWLNEDASNR